MSVDGARYRMGANLLSCYIAENNCLKRVEQGSVDVDSIVWFDLYNPSVDRAEELFVEAALKVDVPTREEVNTLELSSRLYQEDGAVFLTETMLANTDHKDPRTVSVTFVLKGNRLVTLRYDEFPPLKLCVDRALKPGSGCVTGQAVFKSIIETTLDRVGEVLERVGAKVDALSHTIFLEKGTKAFSNRAFKEVLLTLGREETVVAKVRDSLVNLGRMSVFCVQAANTGLVSRELEVFFKTEARDIEALAQYVSHLTSKITFLLDATLGLVSIEQNAIIKIFSVAAVLFLPPTLIASIYGMNFHFMPELGWIWGYPLALVLMVISALLPVWFFRSRGWL